MAYITNQNVIDRIGEPAAVEYTTDSGSTVNTAIIDEIIAEVEGEIDTVVQMRTTETITQADHPKTFAALAGKAIAMTRWRLGLRRPNPPDGWKAANDQALQWLKELAGGERNFPDAVLNSSAPTWGSTPPAATRENMGVGPTE